MYKRSRLDPEVRKQLIVSTAFSIAYHERLFNLNIARVSRSLDTTATATIKHYYTLEELQNAVAVYAIKEDCKHVVAQAIVMKLDAVAHLTDEKRREYLEHV